MNLRPTGTDPSKVQRMDMLPIEKGVPMPQGQVARGVIANTLRAMAAGDSFVVKPTSVSTVYVRAKDLGIRIRVAELPDKSGSRVWRLA